MIKRYIEFILEKNSDIWYHGTPDSRSLDKDGFIEKYTSVEYITNPDEFKTHQLKLNDARKVNDEKEYHRLLDQVSDFKKTYKFSKPVFLTNHLYVAKSYANPKRAFDYQNATETVLKIECNCNKIVTINAYGYRFRFIDVERVKKGFINAGISESEINGVIDKFNFYVSNNNGIKTDTIAAIGSWFNFDCIDVKGVLDSYQGGTIKSTVRIVLNTNNINILD
jgi:hypothetical protein